MDHGVMYSRKSSGRACDTVDYDIKWTTGTDFNVVQRWRTLLGHSLERCRRRRGSRDPDVETINCQWPRPLRLPRVQPSDEQWQRGGTASEVVWVPGTQPGRTGIATSTMRTGPLHRYEVQPAGIRPTRISCDCGRVREWKPRHRITGPTSHPGPLHRRGVQPTAVQNKRRELLTPQWTGMPYTDS